MQRLVVSFALAALIPCHACSQDDDADGADAALGYLSKPEDEYAAQVGVFTEPNAGGSLFWPSWWLNGPTGLAINAECDEHPHSKPACIRITWRGLVGRDGCRRQGVAFHDSPNAIRLRGRGHDLSAATQFSLWYRVMRLDGEIRFVSGYFEEPEQERTVAIGARDLARAGGLGVWQRLVFDLEGRDFSNVHTALQVIMDGAAAGPEGPGPSWTLTTRASTALQK